MVTQPSQGSSVPSSEETLHDHLLDGVGQMEQPKRIGHRRSATTHPYRHLVLCKPEFVHQTMEGRGLLQWIEVISVDVLDNGLLETVPITDIPDQRGYGRQPGPPSRSPATLPSHQFKAVLGPAHENRLQNTDLLDR